MLSVVDARARRSSGVAGVADLAEGERGVQRGGGRVVALVLGDPSRPARASACSSSSQVRTPKPTGVPVSSATRVSPSVAAEQTYSKCGVPPRTTTPSATTASWVRASSAATTGSSKVPGTRTSVTSVTEYAVSARRAPSSRPSMTWVCHRAATTPTERSLQSTGSSAGAPAPLIEPRRGRSRIGVVAAVARQVREVVTHPVALGAQVAQVVRVRPWRQRDLGVDGDPEVGQRLGLVGVVGQQPHGGDAEVAQHLRRGAVVAGVGGQPEVEVGVDGVAAGVLERVGLELGDQPDPAALVAAQVDHDPAPGARHALERLVQLRPAVATLRPEHVTGQALASAPGSAPARRRRDSSPYTRARCSEPSIDER